MALLLSREGQLERLWTQSRWGEELGGFTSRTPHLTPHCTCDWSPKPSLGEMELGPRTHLNFRFSQKIQVPRLGW